MVPLVSNIPRQLPLISEFVSSTANNRPLPARLRKSSRQTPHNSHQESSAPAIRMSSNWRQHSSKFKKALSIAEKLKTGQILETLEELCNNDDLEPEVREFMQVMVDMVVARKGRIEPLRNAEGLLTPLSIPFLPNSPLLHSTADLIAAIVTFGSPRHHTLSPPIHLNHYLYCLAELVRNWLKTMDPVKMPTMVCAMLATTYEGHPPGQGEDPKSTHFIGVTKVKGLTASFNHFYKKRNRDAYRANLTPSPLLRDNTGPRFSPYDHDMIRADNLNPSESDEAGMLDDYLWGNPFYHRWDECEDVTEPAAAAAQFPVPSVRPYLKRKNSTPWESGDCAECRPTVVVENMEVIAEWSTIALNMGSGLVQPACPTCLADLSFRGFRRGVWIKQVYDDIKYNVSSDQIDVRPEPSSILASSHGITGPDQVLRSLLSRARSPIEEVHGPVQNLQEDPWEPNGIAPSPPQQKPAVHPYIPVYIRTRILNFTTHALHELVIGGQRKKLPISPIAEPCCCPTYLCRCQ
ncbi:hypothetical protein BJ508DRAFT_311851 [Ascobolus immersus RN42]|uniref:Uncharacterized protein n=1 Tax=Ascobolus immersus RN42 TaxID=1160509 RepID=A0A3N4HNY8_ASCIM|nr:hypothetical protein BJ508DRAFT_311851 [Ascobolus immersus RN42]